MEATGLKGIQWFYRGDVASADFAITDFTTDEQWYDKDFSNIVPSGTKAVLLRARYKANTTAGWMNWRRKGDTGSYANAPLTVVVGAVSHSTDLVVFLNTARVAQYQITNVTWSFMNIVVAAYGK